MLDRVSAWLPRIICHPQHHHNRQIFIIGKLKDAELNHSPFSLHDLSDLVRSAHSVPNLVEVHNITFYGYLPMVLVSLSKCESEFETVARKIFIDGRLGSWRV